MKAPFVLAASLIVVGCVRLDALDPNSGPERTLVQVQGRTLFSSVIWDRGAPTEQTLQGGFLAANLFTVPARASLGAHQVALKRGWWRTRPLPFTVTAAQPFGPPRVDRVSLAYASFSGTNATTWLYVQAANGDVDADVLVNGTVQPTVAHKGLRNNLFDIAPTDFGYPVYHWVSYLVPWTGTTGSTIQVQVRNSDSAISGSSNYTQPASAASLDSDGDDLPDQWEVSGYDANADGTLEVDLPALGADPYRPDIFVEADVMLGLTNPPDAAVWTGIENVYTAAPVINPVGDNGVHIEIDRSGTVPFWSAIDFNIPDNPVLSQADFYTLKGANFDNAARGRIYHYVIWANARPSGSSGVSDVDFTTGNGGDDAIVSFDDFSSPMQTDKSKIETFVHELGHNLAQRHGGTDHWTNNPTYSSVMSYNWQLRTGRNDAFRRLNPVYSPLYYLTAGAHEVNGALPATFSDLTSYSDGMGRDLNEACLDEPTGLYGGNAVDWNRDGDQTDVCGSRDMDSNGSSSDVHGDFANWPSIIYVGPRTNGRFGG